MKGSSKPTVFIRLAVFILMITLFLAVSGRPKTAQATASWLWHGGNIVAGGVSTDVVLPGQAVTVWLKVGYDGYINQGRIYYTTNGTEPQGSYDTVTNGTKINMTFDHTEADPGGTVAWWIGTIPSQAAGTQVRYKISTWHSGGGDIVYAESPVGKTLNTSSEATTFGYYVGAYATPQWAKDATIYQVFIDRFYDGNTANNIDCTTGGGGYCVNDIFKWNGGDLAGAQARIDYLQSLGINTLWLSPVYENPVTQIGSVYDANPGEIYNYHGYEASDFLDVEDNFGNNANLTSLITAAHAAGMKVILDFVPNHSSNQHPYFKDASDNCTSSPYFRWYKFGSVDAEGKLVSYNNSLCVAGHTNWWGDNDTYSNFFGVKEMPQVDNDYGPARIATINQALTWVNTYDVDGLRLDYAPGPSHSFWLAFRAAVKAADPNIFLVGEVWTGGGAAERKSYEGELDGVLSFDHNDLFLQFFAWRSINVDSFDSSLSYFESYYAADYVLPTFLDNHDKNRFLFEAGQNTNRLKLAFLAQMTLTEPPVIYYGSEVGLTQAVANGGQPERSRERMRWGGYLGSPPTGWNTAQDTGVRDYVDALIGLRNTYSALRTGPRTALYRHNSDSTFAYKRTDANNIVLVAMNNSDFNRSLNIPNLAGQTLGWADGTVVQDKLTGTTYTVSGGQLNISLNAMQGAVLVAINTGNRNPSAAAAATGGDGNGFQTSPTNAYSDNATFAVDTDSGTDGSTSCTAATKDKHLYYNYGFTFPGTVAINGIEVRLDAKADSTASTPKLCVQLSWDGGTSWTTAKSTATLTTSEASYTLGGSADNWGRTWTTGNLSNANFRVRVIMVSSSTSRDFSLDWVAVKVHH